LKYSIVTFGCRVNQADSLGFEEDLIARGAEAVPLEAADMVVVNTCSVTASADQAARQAIRRIGRVNPGARIVVTGCYATRSPGDVHNLPNVVAVVPNEHKPDVIPLIAAAEPGFGPTTAERFGRGEGSCGGAIEPGVAGRTAYTLRVQTGCAEACSYCIIPKTRGAPRSVPTDAVLAEARRVASLGFREIALTGVHLGSYGRDMLPSSSLPRLLRGLADWSMSADGADVVFRISSLEPMDCATSVVDLVAASPTFAPHFHLPLQHASNRILAAMRRPYTIQYYMDLVGEIRRRLPHAAIGSDVIVGFPGETDEDFSELVNYLERSPLTHVHVFPYSDRPGTLAAGMCDRVAPPIVRARAQRVREISERLSKRFRESQVGVCHRALTLENGQVAVTGNYLKVAIPPGHRRNEWVTVRLSSDSRLADVVE
jgi:threonylcarbamoyladenosine tRNA methylthiotransferase MtaB